ncbi:hypothetical protein BDR22DRAFT_975864 [Usnea florida]
MAIRHIQRLWQAAKLSRWGLPPTLATHNSGGTNLEIFKFGMYIMFPIGWMYYFGVNLETRFAVPDFWPAPGTTHRIPFEKDELRELSERLKADRLEKRRVRLERERRAGGGAGEDGLSVELGGGVEGGTVGKEAGGTFGVGSIERWARGRWRD